MESNIRKKNCDLLKSELLKSFEKLLIDGYNVEDETKNENNKLNDFKKTLLGNRDTEVKMADFKISNDLVLIHSFELGFNFVISVGLQKLLYDTEISSFFCIASPNNIKIGVRKECFFKETTCSSFNEKFEMKIFLKIIVKALNIITSNFETQDRRNLKKVCILALPENVEHFLASIKNGIEGKFERDNDTKQLLLEYYKYVSFCCDIQFSNIESQYLKNESIYQCFEKMNVAKKEYVIQEFCYHESNGCFRNDEEKYPCKMNAKDLLQHFNRNHWQQVRIRSNDNDSNNQQDEVKEKADLNLLTLSKPKFAYKNVGNDEQRTASVAKSIDEALFAFLSEHACSDKTYNAIVDLITNIANLASCNDLVYILQHIKFKSFIRYKKEFIIKDEIEDIVKTKKLIKRKRKLDKNPSNKNNIQETCTKIRYPVYTINLENDIKNYLNVYYDVLARDIQYLKTIIYIDDINTNNPISSHSKNGMLSHCAFKLLLTNGKYII
uniref:ATP-dependent DNA helicase n=1 Tax=Strongyloides papillosus TaxID=174720 RepID=A0A0N5CI65_STREA